MRTPARRWCLPRLPNARSARSAAAQRGRWATHLPSVNARSLPGSAAVADAPVADAPSADAGRRARARAAWLNALALALFLAAYANERAPVLRLASAVANALAFLGASALPWAALVAGQRVLRGRASAAHALLLAPVLLGTIPLGTCALLTAGDTARRGVDHSFAPRRTLRLGPARVRVYRTNCGAPCDFGVVVRHERALLPGLLLVRDVGRWYHAQDATVRPIPGGIEVTVVPTDPRYRVPVGPHRVALRPWVRH